MYVITVARRCRTAHMNILKLAFTILQQNLMYMRIIIYLELGIVKSLDLTCIIYQSWVNMYIATAQKIMNTAKLGACIAIRQNKDRFIRTVIYDIAQQIRMNHGLAETDMCKGVNL